MKRLKQYFYLMRLHKPIGIFLLLWPTLWGLWIAGNGQPNGRIVCIFLIGVIVMRSAGCIINDIADKEFDKYVERTRERPLTSGKISLIEAYVLFGIFISVAFVLAILLNPFSIFLAFVGAALTIVYPFMKRFTHLPQFGLGLAFSWGVPMSFAAIHASVPMHAWILFFAALLWPMIYDTMYAMVDRNDDIQIGVKSTAIMFGNVDRHIIAGLQICFILLLTYCGYLFHLREIYFINLLLVCGFFIYQQILIRNGNKENCFRAFMNNHWVGLIIFVGIMLSYSL